MLRKKNNTGRLDDSRNAKRVQEPALKSSNTGESKEDIIIDSTSNKSSPHLDEKLDEDSKNITGEQSLDDHHMDITPPKHPGASDFESDDKNTEKSNSDSKYPITHQ